MILRTTFLLNKVLSLLSLSLHSIFQFYSSCSRMSSQMFRSGSSAGRNTMQQPSAPTTSNADPPSKRSSFSSGPSIADVEAGFLHGASSKGNRWRDTRLLRSLFPKLRFSSSAGSMSDEQPRRKLTKTGLASILLGLALFGVSVTRSFRMKTMLTIPL